MEAARPARFVSIDSLVQYLVDTQVINAADIVDDPAFRVEDRSRRNRNFKVIRSNGSRLMVKQAGSADPESVGTLRTEALILEAVANDEHFKSLRWFTPQLVHHDNENNIVITELVHPATSLTKFHLNGGKVEFAEEMGATCGRVMANFHTVTAQGYRRGYLAFLKPTTPFILKAQDMWRKNLEVAGEAGGQLVRELRKTTLLDNIPAIIEVIASSKEVVHGDVRWDNFLLTYGAAPGNNMNVRLIDWELVNVGDSAWDVTAYLVEFHRFWLSTATMLAKDTEDLSAAKGAFEWPFCHAAAKAFLSAYIRRRGLKKRQANSLVQRIGMYLPYALLLVSYESTQKQSIVPLGARAGLAMAVRAHASPAECMREWYGIEVKP